VAIKTPEQMDLLALHRVRSRPVSQRTGAINQIRGGVVRVRSLTSNNMGLPRRGSLFSRCRRLSRAARNIAISGAHAIYTGRVFAIDRIQDLRAVCGLTARPSVDHSMPKRRRT